jgi:transposase
LRLVPDESGQQTLVQRLRGVITAKDEQIEALTARLETAIDRTRRLELRVGELERRLSMDSSDSGTPSSKEGIGAKAARKAREKKGRQESERERSKDRKRGGQPGHQGKGLKRDPDPDDTRTADAPAECRSCDGSLDGADSAEPRWAQVIDIEFLRKVTEVLLPGLSCGDCGTVTYAAAPAGFHPGSVSYGPVLNGAAVLLSCFGNVPAERSARLIGMLTGQDVSSGWVGKAVARVDAGLRAAGFDEAMLAALAAEDVLAADETPVSVTDKPPSRTRNPTARRTRRGGRPPRGRRTC